MASDEDLKTVAGALRELEAEETFDDRWTDLAAGRASPEELAELEALASESPAAEWGLEAFRPLPAEQRQAIARRVIAQMRQGDAETAADLEAAVEPRAPRRWLRWGWVGLVPAAAVASFLLVFWESTPDTELPTYTLQVTGGDRALRSDGSEPVTLRLRPDSLVDIAVRPRAVVVGPVDMRALLTRPDEVQALSTPVDRAETGAFHLAGTAAELFPVPPGRWQLVLIVGRGDLSSLELQTPHLLAALERSAEIVVLRQPIHLIEPPAE